MQDNRDSKPDEALRQVVLRELQLEPSLAASRVDISTTDGRVTLAGTVSTLAAKHAAERVVKRVYGVRDVVDGLAVVLDDKDRRSDAELLAAARSALEWDSTVQCDRIKVEVKDGWITLEGEVDWQFQREAAARAVRSLTGAVGLSNLLCVRSPEQVASDDVKREIADAFRRSADLEAHGIGVETSDAGKVTLFGNIRNRTEFDEAQRAAWSVPGVSEVDNRLIIVP